MPAPQHPAESFEHSLFGDPGGTGYEQDGPDLADMGYLSLPAEVQEAVETGPARPDYAGIVRRALALAAGDVPQAEARDYVLALEALDAGEIEVTVRDGGPGSGWYAQYAVAWGRYVELYNDEEDATEHVSQYGPDARVVWRMVACGPWEPVTDGSAPGAWLDDLAAASLSAMRAKYPPASGTEPPAERAQQAPPASAPPGAGAGVAPGGQEGAQERSEPREAGS